MKCSGCGSEYFSDNMPKFCPECGTKLDETETVSISKEKEQFSFANTVYNIKCPSCNADNVISHGYSSCSSCSKPIHLYVNDNCEIAAASKFYGDSLSDAYGEPVTYKNYQKTNLQAGQIIFVLVLILFIILPIAYGIISNMYYENHYSSYTYTYDEPYYEYWDYSWTSEAVEQNLYYYPGDTFVFDDIEFTFSGDIVKWDTIDNEYSDNYEADVFAVAVTIKNIKDETHNVSTYLIEYYGSDNIRTDDMSTYFLDSMYFASDMRSGAQQETLVYMKYTGNGSYRIIFSDYYSSKIVLELTIEK